MDQEIVEDINDEFHSPPMEKNIMHNNAQQRFNYKLFNNDSPFRILPCASTPPSNTFRVENPFEKRLKEKLHTHFMSPTVFMKCNTPKSEQKFKWTIEDISFLNPVDIDESSVAKCYSIETDIVKDTSMQEQIDKYFSMDEILPSPHQQQKQGHEVTFIKPIDNKTMQKKDNETQTMLSLPMDLPKKLEMLLKPYFNDGTENHQSLYTKLFENDTDDEDNSIPSTPTTSPLISAEAGSPIISQCKNQSVLSISSLDISFDNKELVSYNTSRISNESVAKVPDCVHTEIDNDVTNETYFNISGNKWDGNTSIENSFSPDRKGNFIEIDVTNSNTPRSKLFSSQRKKLSDSFLMEFEDDNKENNDYNQMIVMTNEDIGYFSTTTMDESNWNGIRLRASTPTDF